jgi:hypothetical protein
MQMLYDSDSFAVVQIHANVDDTMIDKTSALPAPLQLERHGFEIVDKRSGKEVYLDGSWAELFQQRLNVWQQKTPTQEEVENMLEGYAELAQTPVSVH